MNSAPTVGVLALQGAVSEHSDIMTSLGARTVLVRRADQIDGLAGIIIPGGESTAMARIAAPLGLFPVLRERVIAGLPVLGTCAGLILLADRVKDAGALNGFDRLATLDITAQRNAYGNQLASFEAPVTMPEHDHATIDAAFIRAPVISEVGPAARVIAEHGNTPVAVQQDHQIAATFHPEITGDTTLHQMLYRLISGA